MSFVVCDLDGTLADDRHRQHYLEQQPQDWESYFAACGDDIPVWPVIMVVNALWGGQVEIWTGRSEVVRETTVQWLANYGIRYTKLRMRPEGDYRPDTELKGEWLAECDPPPWVVFDDRSKSVAWWRSQGVVCLQVADHDY